MRYDKELQFAPDYRIHLIAPAHMADEDFLKFRTGFGQVLQYIKYSKNKEKLYQVTHEEKRFSELDEDSANLINTVTGSGLKFEVKEGRVNMCTAIDEMRKESRNEGKDEGILSSLKNLMANMNLTLQQAMDALGIPAADRPKYMSKL